MKTRLIILPFVIGGGFLLGRLIAPAPYDADSAQKDSELEATILLESSSPSSLNASVRSLLDGTKARSKAGIRGFDKTPPELNLIIRDLLQGKNPKNWEQTFQEILKYTASGKSRHEALLVFFSAWSEVDFPRAMECASKLPGYQLVKHDMIAHFASIRDQEALDYYEHHKDMLDPIDAWALLGEVTKSRTRTNPDEALAWCLSFEDTSQQHLLIAKFMEEVGFSSDAMKDYVNTIYAQNGKVSLPSLLIWKNKSPEAFENWLKTSAPPDVIQSIPQQP